MQARIGAPRFLFCPTLGKKSTNYYIKLVATKETFNYYNELNFCVGIAYRVADVLVTPPPPPPNNDDVESRRQSSPNSSSAIWRRIDPTCAHAFILREQLSASIGEASGRNTERDNDDYDNDRLPS